MLTAKSKPQKHISYGHTIGLSAHCISMATLGLAEALKGARETKNVTLKVEALQKIPEDTKQQLFGVFQLAYSDKIRWVLPEGDPPYKALEESSDAQGRLIMELKG